MQKRQNGLTPAELDQETQALARDLSFHARAPVSIQLVGGSHIAFTYNADDSGKQHNVPIVMNPSILDTVRTREQAIKIWRGIGYHELAHHLWPATAQYKIAIQEGFKELFNLVDDEQNERRGRALDPDWGACFQAVCAHIFSKAQRRKEAQEGLLSTGIIDGDSKAPKPSVKGRAATRQYTKRWNEFKYHLRLHIDKDPSDPVVAEALALIGTSFKNLSKKDLLELTRQIHNILCSGIELPKVEPEKQPKQKPKEDNKKSTSEPPAQEPPQPVDAPKQPESENDRSDEESKEKEQEPGEDEQSGKEEESPGEGQNSNEEGSKEEPDEAEPPQEDEESKEEDEKEEEENQDEQEEDEKNEAEENEDDSQSEGEDEKDKACENPEPEPSGKGTWSLFKLLSSKFMLVPFLLFVLGWTSLLLRGSLTFWARVAVATALFGGALITFLFLRRAFIKSLLARIKTAVTGGGGGPAPVGSAGPGMPVGAAIKRQLTRQWVRGGLAIAGGVALLGLSIPFMPAAFGYLGTGAGLIWVASLMLLVPPVVMFFLLKKAKDPTGLRHSIGPGQWTKTVLIGVSAIGGTLLIFLLAHGRTHGELGVRSLVILLAIVVATFGVGFLIMTLSPSMLPDIGEKQSFGKAVFGAAYRSGRGYLNHASASAWEWAVVRPVSMGWRYLVVIPLSFIWKWLIVFTCKFSWRRLIVPTAKFVWFVVTVTARFIWHKVTVPTARFIWFLIVVTVRFIWRVIIVGTARFVWCRIVVPTATFVWLCIVVPSAKFVWGVITEIAAFVRGQLLRLGKWLKRHLLRLLYFLAPRLRRLWRRPLFRLAVLALPVAMIAVMIYALIYSASKISWVLVIILIVLLLLLFLLGFLFRKKIKRFVVTELFMPMPSLMDYFMAVPLDMKTEWFVQVDNTVPIAADPGLAQQFLEAAAPLAQQLRTFLARCGRADADREDQIEGFDLIDEAEQAFVGETAIFVDDESKPKTSLHLEVALDCSSSMACATQTLAPGQKFALGKFMAFVLEQACVNLPGVSSHFWGFTDNVIYDCGTAGEGRVTGLPLGGGNNDAAMLWKMAKSAEVSGKDVKVLIMLSDGQPSECSWLSLHNLVLQLEQEGMIPWNFALDVINTPAFERFFTDLVGQSMDEAVITMTETLAQIAEESSW